ncbi:MAG: NYN domain-containing protein, partial [bacterium]|nr:NYN domain-containing protein [bacterium]
MQTRLKSALFLDFDNVYGGLNGLDPEQAEAMADEPWKWLRHLLEQAGPQVSRDVLVRRAYLNPAGRVQNREGTWTYFSTIRPRLTRSGFEVIDCPSLTAAGKNAADIRIVMDVLSYMAKNFRYDEFVIASSDADFTPLLYQLRADDRRTVIVAAGQTSTAYSEVADAVLDIGQLLEAGKLSLSDWQEVIEGDSVLIETSSGHAGSSGSAQSEAVSAAN